MRDWKKRCLDKVRAAIDWLDWTYCRRVERWYGPRHDYGMAETDIAIVKHACYRRYRGRVFKRSDKDERFTQYYLDVQEENDDRFYADDEEDPGEYRTILFLSGTEIDAVGELIKEAARVLVHERADAVMDGDGIYPRFPKKVPPVFTVEPWEGHEYGVAINGRICGKTLDHDQAGLVRDWLETAFAAVAAQAVTSNFIR